MRLRCLVPCVIMLCVIGCGGEVVIDHDLRGPGDDSDGGGGATAGAGGAGNAGGAGGIGTSTGGGDPVPTSTVLANGKTTLYNVDPAAQVIVATVPLSGCTNELIDIAVSRSGSVFGVSSDELYQIDPVTGGCVVRGHGEYPNSLVFLPNGVLDQDVLVGYRDATYYRINPINGELAVIGDLGDGYLSSGDLIATDDSHAYLTVRGNGCDDCLAEVDPATGALVALIGPLGYSHVYGLARVEDQMYGFSAGGLMLRINVKTAAAEVLPLMNGTAGLSFWGAASGLPMHATLMYGKGTH